MPERPSLQEFLRAAEQEERNKKKKKIATAGGIIGAGAVVIGLGAREALREEPNPASVDQSPTHVQRVDPAELAREREEFRPKDMIIVPALPENEESNEGGDTSLEEKDPKDLDVVPLDKDEETPSMRRALDRAVQRHVFEEVRGRAYTDMIAPLGESIRKIKSITNQRRLLEMPDLWSRKDHMIWLAEHVDDTLPKIEADDMRGICDETASYPPLVSDLRNELQQYANSVDQELRDMHATAHGQSDEQALIRKIRQRIVDWLNTEVPESLRPTMVEEE